MILGSSQKHRKQTLEGQGTLDSQKIRDEINVSINQHSQPTPSNEDDINIRSSLTISSDIERDADRNVFEDEEEEKETNHFQNANNDELEEVKEQRDNQGTQSSVVHFDARFSTLESGRENQQLKFNNRLQDAQAAGFFVPKSNSEYPPVTQQPLDEPVQPEFRPSTQVTRNK